MSGDREPLHKAFSLHQTGRFVEAGAAYRKVLKRHPDNVLALHGLGAIEASLGHFREARSLMNRSLQIQPSNIRFLENYATLLYQSGDYDGALQTCDRGLRLDPGNAALRYVGAIALYRMKRFEDSLLQFDKHLSLQPNSLAAINERGSLLAEMGRYDAASEAFQKAIRLAPNYAPAHLNCGNLFGKLHRSHEALSAYERTLALKPDFAEAWLGRGNVLAGLKRYDEAIAAYDKALALKVVLGEAWFGRGNALAQLNRYDEAITAYDKALALDQEPDYLAAARLHAKLHVCDWTRLEAEASDLVSLSTERAASNPFFLLPISSSPSDLLGCTRRYVKEQAHFAPLWRGEIYSHDRIRVAYLSADFRDHPVARLMAALFEQHDRSQFEVTGISFGSDQSALGKRVKSSFEHLIEADRLGDQQIAALIKRSEIDIAVDLTGHTLHNRFGVLARRAAPIQVNYLGYLGTLGAPFIDYVIADKIALPADQQPYYDEKIIHLPGCFLAAEDRQDTASRAPSRSEAGLPEDGFVFCCFNNSYKLNRPLFECWMRILGNVPDSVLWLAQSNDRMTVNLRAEAERCGVGPARLVFAQRLPMPQHLARQRLAGLFLDTVPYNAGATAVAALQSGIPVVTISGDTFVGRIATSMLHAIGLPELATQGLQDYEALATKLAREPLLLAGIRRTLQENRSARPLFDTDRFRRHLEQAYQTMVARLRRGEPPRSFSVEGG